MMDWLDPSAVQGILKSLLQHHSSKASILWCSAFFIVHLSHSYVTAGKTIAFTRWTFVAKIMSLLFNMLSRLVVTFLPRSKRLLISWLQSPSAVIWEPPKIKSDTVSTASPSISHEVTGSDAMILVFWMLSFKPTFSLSFIKRLFSSSSLSAIRVVSSAYLRLLIFILAILIPACASSSPACLMMCSAYKLNKQGDNIQPWLTPFPPTTPPVPSSSVLISFLNCSVTKSCLILCDPMNCTMLGFPVLHHLPKLAQTHVHSVIDALQPSRHLLSPFPLPSIFPTIRVFCNELFTSGSQSIGISAFQHQSFQWIFRTDFL